MKRISTAVPAILGALLAIPALVTPAAAQVAAEAAVVTQKPKAKARAKAAPVAKAPAPGSVPVAEGRTELAPAMQLAEGKSSIVRLQHPAARVAVGDARIADVILLNPKELYLLGRTVGTTNLILWQKTGDTIIADLTVSTDVVTLQDGIDKLTGQKGMVKVTPAADSIMLSGVVPDVVMAEHVLQLANAFVTRARPTGGGPGAASGGTSGGTGNAQGDGGLSIKIINMMSIAAPQQVMLEVKVAEVSKTLVDQLGASIGASHAIGNWTYTLLSNLLTGNPGLLDAFNRRNGNFLTIDAQKRDGLVKMLAEPNVMAISGQEASFLAGGRIYIPVASTPEGGFTRITLEEKEFGVAVRFTPTVLADGRINLKVAPEVSELNREGVGISAAGVGGTAILPSFTTRRASTVVQLYDGQSFAIGGLIKNSSTANIKALPVLGEVPVLGALFRSNDFQNDRTELVFVITPRLVKPLPPDFAERLPTAQVTDPSRVTRIFNGKLEGTPPQDSSKPATQPAKPAGGFDLN